MTYTGLTFQSVFSPSWASQCTVAYRIRLRFTWWTAVVESRILSVGAIYDQRVNTVWLNPVTGWLPWSSGQLLLTGQLGTLYQWSPVAVLDGWWKRDCLRWCNAHSAVKIILWRCAIQMYDWHWHRYLNPARSHMLLENRSTQQSTKCLVYSCVNSVNS